MANGDEWNGKGKHCNTECNNNKMVQYNSGVDLRNKKPTGFF